MQVSARNLLIFIIVLLLSTDVIDKTITPRTALFLVHTSRVVCVVVVVVVVVIAF